MALTPSTMLPLGEALPSFQLPVVSGSLVEGKPAATLSDADLPAQPLLELPHLLARTCHWAEVRLSHDFESLAR